MEDVKRGSYISGMSPATRDINMRKGTYIGDFISTKRHPRIRKGYGMNTIIKEVMVDDGDKELLLPRGFPLEYSWTKTQYNQ